METTMNKHSSPTPVDPLDMMVKARLIRWRCMTRAARTIQRAAMSFVVADRSRPNPLTMRGLDIS